VGQKVSIPIHSSGTPGGGASGKSSSDTSGKKQIGKAAGAFGGLSGLAMPAGIAGLAVGITGLVGDLVALSSTLGPVITMIGSAMPMAAVGAASTIGTLFLAFHGVTGALQAMSKASDGTKASQDALNKTMAKLPPQAQALVKQVYALKPAFDNLQKTAQTALFPGLTAMIKSLATTLPTINAVVSVTGKALGGLAQDFGKLFASPAFQKDLGTVGAANAQVIGNLGHALLSVVDIFRNLSAAVAPFVVEWSAAVKKWMEGAAAAVQLARHTGALNVIFQKAKVVGQELGRIFGNTFRGLWSVLKVGFPYGLQLLDMLERWSAHFRAWAKTAAGQQQINQFFQGSVVIFKLLGEVIGGLGKLLLWAVAEFRNLSGAVDWLGKNMDLVRNIVLAVAAAFVAFKVGSPVVQGIRALAPLFAAMVTPIGLAAVAIAGIAAGLVILFTQNKAFHDWVLGAWDGIKSSMAGAWDSIKKTTQEVWPVIKDTISTAAKVIGDAFVKFLIPALDHLVPAFGSIVGAAANIASIFVSIVAPVAAVAIALAAPVFSAVATVFQALAGAVQAVTGYLKDHLVIVVAIAAAYGILKAQMIAAAVLGGYAAAWNAIGAVLGRVGSIIAGIPGLFNNIGSALTRLGGGSLAMGSLRFIGLGIAIAGVVAVLGGYAQANSRAQATLDGINSRTPLTINSVQSLSDRMAALTQQTSTYASATDSFWSWGIGMLSGASQEASAGLSKVGAAQDEVTQKMHNLNQNSRIFAEQSGMTTMQVKGLATSLNIDLSQSSDQASAAWNKAVTALREGAPAGAALSTQIVTLTANEKTTKDASDAWSSSLDKLFAPFASYESACTTLAGDVDTVNTALAASKGVLDNTTAASRASRQALTDEATQILTVAKAQQTRDAATMGSEQATRNANAAIDKNNDALFTNAIAHGANRDQLVAWANAMGWSKDQVAALSVVTDANASAAARSAAQMTLDKQVAQDYGQSVAALANHIVTLPDGRTVTINLNDHDFIAKAEAAGLKVKTLPDGRVEITGDLAKLTDVLAHLPNPAPIVVPISAAWQAVGWNPKNTVTGGAAPTPATQRRATGGWVFGPGTATSDSIPARLSAGEYVVNAKSASRHAGLLQQINGMASGGVVGRDGIPRFAGGGTVVATPSGSGLTISGDISPISVPLTADLTQLYTATAAFHPVAWLTLSPDFAQVYAAAAAFKPVAWLVLYPEFSQVYAAAAAFHPVAWLVLVPDFAQVYTQVAAFRPVGWLVLVPDLAQVYPAVAAFKPVTWLTIVPDTAPVMAALAVLAASHPPPVVIPVTVPGFAEAIGMLNALNATSRAVDPAVAIPVTIPGVSEGIDWLHRLDQAARAVRPFIAIPVTAPGIGDVTNQIANLGRTVDSINGKIANMAVNAKGVVSVSYMGAATGGYISGPGGPTSDSIPAYLSNGEYVINAAATRRHLPLLHQINSQKFADGGMAGGSLGAAFATAANPGAGAFLGAAAGSNRSSANAGIVARGVATNIANVTNTVANFPKAATDYVGKAAVKKTSDLEAAAIARMAAMGAGGGGGGVADSNAVIALAKAQIGKPYVWGATGPDAFDCQGLVGWVFRHFGISLPGGATNQIAALPHLAPGQQQPGDVVGFHSDGSGYLYHHIGIVSGADQMINALGSQWGVRVDSINNITSGPGAYHTFARVLQNLNPGYGTPEYNAAHAGGGAGAGVGGGGHFSQGQIEATMRSIGASADIAHIFGAIAMHENPASTRIHNYTGWYDSVYALGESWTVPMGLDTNRLNTDLTYASQVALNLWRKSGFGPWEAYTNGMYRASMAEGGPVKPVEPLGMSRGGVVPGSGSRDSVPALLTPGEIVIPKRMATGGVAAKPPTIDFNMGGYKAKINSSFGGAGRYMGGQWNPAGDWTTEAAFAHMTAGQKFAYWSKFPEVMKYFSFNRVVALARAASGILHHPPGGYMSWPPNRQFVYWAQFPAVTALFKAMNAQKGNITNKPKGDIWHGGHYQMFGKQIPGMAMGGVAAGGLTQLHAGEFVVNAAAAKRYAPQLTLMNSKRGSPAPSIHNPATASSAPSTPAGPNVTHNWTVAVAPDAKPRTVARELAWEFAGARGA
jgi:cell wall-associated NlpC family hydrolase